jgi:L,D-peptidoglycan transpeptidase YkuD (ErfK/YbiS/YcfS/YnhG family)
MWAQTWLLRQSSHWRWARPPRHFEVCFAQSLLVGSLLEQRQIQCSSRCNAAAETAQQQTQTSSSQKAAVAPGAEQGLPHTQQVFKRDSGGWPFKGLALACIVGVFGVGGVTS